MKLKIGVLGAGHLGRIHLKLIKEIPEFELLGFYDPDDANAQKAITDLGVKRFDDDKELIQACDCLDIVTTTSAHFQSALDCFSFNKHVFIEKPLTNTMDEAEKLMKIAEKKNLKVQVGHVERFNPAFLALQNFDLHPMFIETHRLATFNPRGTDVAVVLDLMVHDLDIILQLVKSDIKRVDASGVAIISETPDIANARIEFENGCVANVTASRMSVKQMRKTRVFQRDAYISIDFLEKQTHIYRLYHENTNLDGNTFELNLGNGNGKKYINFETPEIKPVNAIKMELELFAQSILNDTTPPVSIYDGYKAMALAHQILEKIEQNQLV